MDLIKTAMASSESQTAQQNADLWSTIKSFQETISRATKTLNNSKKSSKKRAEDIGINRFLSDLLRKNPGKHSADEYDHDPIEDISDSLAGLTLNNIKDRGYRLGSVYEQELEKKISFAIEFNSKIHDFNKRLQVKNSEYLKQEKEFQHEQKSHSENQVSYDSLRLELKRVKENLNSKEYTIECMEKGIEENRSLRDQLVLDVVAKKKNEPESSSAPSEQIIPTTISKEKISLG
ncbi:2426_t:CDS:2, partial [Gigaspora margarita]